MNMRTKMSHFSRATMVAIAALAAAAMGLWPTATQADILRVPSQYATIQAAIDAAVDNDTVLVADGVYTGAGNKNLDYGGKAIAVRSEHGAAATTIDCENDGRGFYFHSREPATAVVDGFTIQHGRMVGGGAVNVENGSRPTLMNCVFADNVATNGQSMAGGGGGVRAYSANPTISDCVFLRNQIPEYGNSGGAGLADFLGNDNLMVARCQFIDNSGAVKFGGAIARSGYDDLSLTDCVFRGNNAQTGGAIYSEGHGQLIAQRCTFEGNTSVWGGVYTNVSNADVTDCLFQSNAAQACGALFNYGSNVHLANCTFTGNSGQNAGAVQTNGSGSTDLANCVLWLDTPREIFLYSGGTLSAAFSDVQGGWPGIGNIDADPLFVDPNNGDFRLQAGSPCIDAGDPNFTGLPGELDLDGHRRIWDGNADGLAIVDMGAYEFGSTHYGDLNCDGVVNFGDIDPFVLALSDPAAYQAAFPNCDILNGDCNGDGVVNFADIDPFVALLSR